jgi:putative transposase
MKPLSERRMMVVKENMDLSITQQCELLKIHKSGFYYQSQPESEENLIIMRKLDEQYYETPFYGVLRLKAWLQREGFSVNIKRVRRLMKIIDWKTIYREPKTTIPNKSHYKYPYLLKGLKIVRKNQVWAMDITYIPMKQGFMYLCAVIDLYSRKVMNWSLSNTMSADWSTETVKIAIEKHGKPEIFNTDQGSQFTSDIFINVLKESNIQISMDGKGRAIDNIFIERLWKSVKYENVYLFVYENELDLYKGLNNYFEFYNHQRLHQSLDYKTPEEVYNQNIAA